MIGSLQGKDWNCPLCKKSDRVCGMSTIYEGNYSDARKFDMICERCRYFWDSLSRTETYWSGRTY